LGKQPIEAEAMAKYKPTDKSGVIIVGSHVQKTTQQLTQLLQQSDIVGIEIDVTFLRDNLQNREKIITSALTKITETLDNNLTPVVYTSRQELSFPDIETRLEFGKQVSAVLMDIVRNLPSDIGFLISKGGITSNDVLSDGLALKEARLLGQILAGCSVIITPKNHHLFPNLPVVLFPGNVGDENGLVTAYQRLK